MASRNAGNAVQNDAVSAGHEARGGALDAMRFSAALLIVIYHYGAEAPTTLSSLSPIFARGYLATDFFLMLSGFVLGRAYGGAVLKGLSSGGFLIKRLKRLWPAHLIVLSMFAVLVLATQAVGVTPRHAGEFPWSALPMQALLAGAWGMPGGGGWNVPTWSLSALVVCYAVFPLIWRRVGRVRRAGLLVVFAFGLVVAGDLASRAMLGHALSDLPFEWGALRALTLFILGACLAQAVALAWPPQAWTLSIALMAATILVMLQAAGRFDIASLACIAAITLALGRRAVTRPSPLIDQAASVSFALFLTHILTATLYFNALRLVSARVALAPAAQWLLWAAAVPTAVVVAVLFDRLIDQPVQRGLDSWLRGRPGLRPTPAPSG